MSPLDTGMSPVQSWLLLLLIVGGGIAFVLWVTRIDDRDYAAEVEEPSSNVTVVDAAAVDCHPDCALAAQAHATRLQHLKETA